MDPITVALLAAALAEGLRFVGEELVKAGIKDAAEVLAGRLPPVRKLKELAKDQALVEAVSKALEQAHVPVEDAVISLDYAKGTSLALLQAESSRLLRQQLAYALLEFTPDQSEPPDYLVVSLRWPILRKDELIGLLRALRLEMSAIEPWRYLISYANDTARSGQLGKIIGAFRSLNDMVLPLQQDVSHLARTVVETPEGPALRVLLVDPSLTLEDAERIRRKYCDDIQRLYRRHLIQGLDPKAGEVKDLPLAEIYTELALLAFQGEEALEEEQQAMLVADLLERQQRQRQHSDERLSNALSEAPRLVILGKPGSGKTFSLRFIAFMLSQGANGAAALGVDRAYLPLLVRLADFAQQLQGDPEMQLPARPQLTLQEFLAEHFRHNCLGEEGAERFIHQALEAGGCAVLLDGLDEVGLLGHSESESQAIQSKVLQRVRDFNALCCSEDRPNRLVVTSRLEGYRRGMLPGFTEAELSPLLFPEEVLLFLQRWFTAFEKTRRQDLSFGQAAALGDQTAANLLGKIEISPGIILLATNPLLLTILIYVYLTGKDLPNQRVELYQVVALTMIRSWRQAQLEKDPQLLDRTHIKDNDILHLMAGLAFWLHEQVPGGAVAEEQWRQRIGELLCQEDLCAEKDAVALAESFLRFACAESGLLTERSAGKIGFFHLTLEEYLAAVEVARTEEEERSSIIDRYWPNRYWTEVLLLTAGELKTTSTKDALKRFITHLLSEEVERPELTGRPAVLAGRALVDIQNRSKGLNEQVQPALQNAMQDLHPITRSPHLPPVVLISTRAEAGDVLDELGWLPENLYAFVQTPAARGQPAFWIAKYPVTNVQYERFLLADDFFDGQLWRALPDYDEKGNLIGDLGNEGWDWLQSTKSDWQPYPERLRKLPVYWRNDRFGTRRRSFPVVGVTWYEASAYCRWLQRHWNDPGIGDLMSIPRLGKHIVRLPLESEWLRAAGGDRPAERFPWDIGKDATTEIEHIVQRANVGESRIGHTTPVCMYPLGRHGEVWDLAGNVWEWQANRYESGGSPRVLRGGSYPDNVRYARCAARFWIPPGGLSGNLGFRVVVVPL